MASESESGGGGGFGWGIVIGGLIGFVAGAYLASGPGREQVENLRTQTIELGRRRDIGGKARSAAERARTAVQDPEHPMRKAIHLGISAARRKRQELDAEAAEAGVEKI